MINCLSLELPLCFIGAVPGPRHWIGRFSRGWMCYEWIASVGWMHYWTGPRIGRVGVSC